MQPKEDFLVDGVITCAYCPVTQTEYTAHLIVTFDQAGLAWAVPATHFQGDHKIMLRHKTTDMHSLKPGVLANQITDAFTIVRQGTFGALFLHCIRDAGDMDILIIPDDQLPTTKQPIQKVPITSFLVSTYG